MSYLFNNIPSIHYMSIIMLNILVYLITFIIFCLILFSVKLKSLVYLDRLNQFSGCIRLRTLLILTIFNISGTPPTPLFLVKACNLYYVYSNLYIMPFVIILLVNLISIVFYVQFLRFIYATDSKISIIVLNYVPFLNKKIFISIIVMFLVLAIILFDPWELLVYTMLCSI